jgi:hypothetical protein
MYPGTMMRLSQATLWSRHCNCSKSNICQGTGCVGTQPQASHQGPRSQRILGPCHERSDVCERRRDRWRRRPQCWEHCESVKAQTCSQSSAIGKRLTAQLQGRFIVAPRDGWGSSARSSSLLASCYWRCKMLHYTARPGYCRKLNLVIPCSLGNTVSGVPRKTVWILGPTDSA